MPVRTGLLSMGAHTHVQQIELRANMMANTFSSFRTKRWEARASKEQKLIQFTIKWTCGFRANSESEPTLVSQCPAFNQLECFVKWYFFTLEMQDLSFKSMSVIHLQGKTQWFSLGAGAGCCKYHWEILICLRYRSLWWPKYTNRV